MSDEVKVIQSWCVCALIAIAIIATMAVRVGEQNRDLEAKMASQGYEQRLEVNGQVLWKKASDKKDEE